VLSAYREFWAMKQPYISDSVSLIDAEKAAYRLLVKFHKESRCGRPFHWAECERLVDVFGWVSWAAWQRSVMRGDG
jgi:hypothetical protein